MTVNNIQYMGANCWTLRSWNLRFIMFNFKFEAILSVLSTLSALLLIILVFVASSTPVLAAEVVSLAEAKLQRICSAPMSIFFLLQKSLFCRTYHTGDPSSPTNKHSPVQHVSSFHKIPNEVLCLMFQELCHIPIALLRIEPTPWPLRLSAVCAQWRTVVQSNPAFWAPIYVSISYSEQNMTPFSLLTIYLERSKDTMLTVVMGLFGKIASDTSKLLSIPAFQALIREAHRWKVLDVITDDVRALSVVPYCPQLETFVLRSGDLIHRGLSSDMIRMPSFTSLTSVVVVTERSSLLLSSYNPWKQLTRLQLQGPHDVLRIVELCRCLRDLTLVVDNRLEFSPFSKRVVYHRSLQNLTLLIASSTDAKGNELLINLLDAFVFPSLTSLRVEQDSVSATVGGKPPVLRWNHALISSFLHKCSCLLESFSLINISVFDRDLLQFLLAMPSLVNLTVHEFWLPDEYATHFPSPLSSLFIQNIRVYRTLPKWSKPLLPRLESLSLVVHSEFDEAIFAETISSRCLSVPGVVGVLDEKLEISRLKHVRLRVGGMGHRLGKMLNSDTLKGLKMRIAREDGITLEVVNKRSILGDCSRVWRHEAEEILSRRG